jgi:hypothetical protein
MEARREDGLAVIMALLAMLLLSALGAALVLTGSGETAIASSFQTGQEVLYAADAIVERSIVDLAGVSDWSRLLDGSVRSGFADGPPGGERAIGPGETVDVSAVINLAGCGKRSACSAADLAAFSDERRWSLNNPRWTLFAYGPASQLVPGDGGRSVVYVAALVGDDPGETDDDPLTDGGPAADGNPPNAGAGVIVLRGEAFGPRGAHKIVEATVVRDTRSAPGVRVVSWRQIR